MRQVESTGVADDTFTDFMDACIQCRGCETACPSGVPFGSMMETTREALADQTKYQPKISEDWGYSILGMPRVTIDRISSNCCLSAVTDNSFSFRAS